MKRFILIFFIGSQLVTAQEESTKKLTYGFNLELNRTNLSLAKSTVNSFAQVYDSYGFGLGLLADYKLNNLISLNFKPTINFSNAYIYFYKTNDSNQKYDIMNTSSSFGLHFNIKTSSLKDSPYLIFGGQYRIPLYINQKSNSNYFRSISTGMVDLGFGFNKSFKVLNLMPEFVYSIGISNINGSPMLTSLVYNQFALVLNFKN